MVYQGSKRRIAKHILPFINKFLDRQFYIEPFVGGANMIDKVNGFQHKIGYDINKYLISLLQYIQSKNNLPESITEKEYYIVRDNKDNYPDWYVGLVGFCSHGGQFFGGYPRGNKPDGTYRDHCAERIRNLLKQQNHLINIQFMCADYKFIELPSQCLIYCDPPYSKGKQYNKKATGVFNHEEFKVWVEAKSQDNPILISEYSMDEPFICIWSGEIRQSLKKDSDLGVPLVTEKLFIHKKWLNYINDNDRY